MVVPSVIVAVQARLSSMQGVCRQKRKCEIWFRNVLCCSSVKALLIIVVKLHFLYPSSEIGLYLDSEIKTTGVLQYYPVYYSCNSVSNTVYILYCRMVDYDAFTWYAGDVK